jgi:hypothetical protein
MIAAAVWDDMFEPPVTDVEGVPTLVCHRWFPPGTVVARNKITRPTFPARRELRSDNLPEAPSKRVLNFNLTVNTSAVHDSTC